MTKPLMRVFGAVFPAVLLMTFTACPLFEEVGRFAGDVTTIAGKLGTQAEADGYVNGSGVDARFRMTGAMTMIGDTLYVVDSSGIRAVNRVSGVTSTLASYSYVSSLGGMATDGVSLYIMNLLGIHRVSIADGSKTLIAGGGGVGCADGGIGVAQFWEAMGMVYLNGCLYITDSQYNTVRKVDLATGMTTTLAGIPSWHGIVDGPAAGASFDTPWGITTDGTDLYIADRRNSRIRRITLSTLTVSTIATEEVVAPQSIAWYDGVLYVGLDGSMSLVGVSVSSGRVFEIAGDPDGYQLVPCDGSGQAARFSNPRGLVVTADGIYVSDYWAIRWVQ